MDSVRLDTTTSSSNVLLLVNATETLPISKEALSRSAMLRSLRLPLRTSKALELTPGYIQTWAKSVSASKICDSSDSTESLLLQLKVRHIFCFSLRL
jgi:hypothetical protein